MSRRVLLVDDDPTTLSILSGALAEAGFAVSPWAEPSAALSQLQTEPHDILLTDFVMPGLSGADLTEAAHTLWPSMRCFIMSGHDRPSGLASRVVWIDKPLDLDHVVTLLSG